MAEDQSRGRPERFGDVARDEYRAHGLVSRRQSLCREHHVWIQVPPIRSEHRSGSAKTTDHFIGDKEHVALTTDCPHLFEVAHRWRIDATGSDDRLAEEGGHPLRAEVIDLLGHGPRVVPLHLLELRGEFAIALAVTRYACQGSPREVHAVIAASSADHVRAFVLALELPVAAGDLDRGVHGIGSTTREEDAGIRHGSHGREPISEIEGRLGREIPEIRIGSDLAHLFGYRGTDLGASVSHVAVPQRRRRIEVGATIRTVHLGALATGDDEVVPGHRGHISERMPEGRSGGGHRPTVVVLYCALMRVVLFGATGYTGRLTAAAMVRAGLAPVLAGRDADALVDLTAHLAPLAPIDAAPTWTVADAHDPATVRALVSHSTDVLVSTVGPFSRYGEPAIEAAIATGCTYIDSTGEGTFIHRVATEFGPRAQSTGARLLSAFAYDYVPGHVAAALAMRRCPEASVSRLEIGYFAEGDFHMSSGTKASIANMAAAPRYLFDAGSLHETRAIPPTTSFSAADGKQRKAMAITGSEQFFLPRAFPRVSTIEVYLGWAGKATSALAVGGAAAGAFTRAPVIGKAARGILSRFDATPTGVGPTPQQRAQSSSVVLARASDGVGRELASSELHGPDPYDLTAELLAWSAAMAADGRINGAGALGPLDAFTPDELLDACACMGLVSTT